MPTKPIVHALGWVAAVAGERWQAHVHITLPDGKKSAAVSPINDNREEAEKELQAMLARLKDEWQKNLGDRAEIIVEGL